MYVSNLVTCYVISIKDVNVWIDTGTTSISVKQQDMIINSVDTEHLDENLDKISDHIDEAGTCLINDHDLYLELTKWANILLQNLDDKNAYIPQLRITQTIFKDSVEYAFFWSSPSMN